MLVSKFKFLLSLFSPNLSFYVTIKNTIILF